MTFNRENEYQTLLLGDSILPARDKHVVRIAPCTKPEYLHELPYKTTRLENKEIVYFQWQESWWMAKCLKGT